MYCYAWSNQKIHIVATGTGDTKTLCGNTVIRTLEDAKAVGQLCEDCESARMVDTDHDDGIEKTPTRFDELEVGQYIYLIHMNNPVVYCIRQIEPGVDTAWHKTYVVHCSRGLTLTGTAAETVPVVASYHPTKE